LGNDYLNTELGVDENPQNENVVMVVDGIFRDVLASDDAVGKHLTKVDKAHSKEGATTLESGLNKIIISHPWPSQLTRQSGINLVDKSHVWKPNSNYSMKISQSADNLTISVNMSKAHKMIKSALLQTKLENLTETPLVLSLEYASKSTNSNAKYFVRNGDENGQKRYFRRDLAIRQVI